MSAVPKLTFARPGGTHRRVVVAFADNKLRFGKQTKALKADKLVARAAKTADFKGKLRTTLSLYAPDIAGVDRLLVVGVGAPGEATMDDWRRLGRHRRRCACRRTGRDGHARAARQQAG